MKKKILFFVIAITLACNTSVFAAKKVCTSAIDARTRALEAEVRALKCQFASMQAVEKKEMYGTLVELYAHGPAVVMSPALGMRRSAEDASDLMVNLPSMNEDLQILQTRKCMDNYALKNCISIPQRPILAVSGGLEAQVSVNRDYSGRKSSDVDLTRAELDFVAEASPWATATIILSFDNSGINGVPNRVMNSRFILSRGFLTIGQLNKFPAYFTLGQIYMPFGKYSSYRVTTPSTLVLGRIQTRAGVIGFDYKGLYGQAYAFPGVTHVPGNVELSKRGGLNLGYKSSFCGKFNFDIGAGVTGNLAEAQGLLDNGLQSPNFKGFDGNKDIKSRVPGVDGYAKVEYKPITFIGELVSATKAFDFTDMSFNGKGAKPTALDAELAYDFKICEKPNTFAVGYGQTWQALALTVPKRDFFAEYNVSIWKDTIESLEFRHNVNYGAHDIASGNNPIPPAPQQNIATNGKISNSLTFQLGIYF